ncbi:MAG: Ppx/GppA family phosphatase, partial [Amylibacter sp.]|nr:Ppx/GppA family phosphatase [Amylibacter sp.]
NPCIGDSRKDFIMSGAAILRSILRVWPTNTLTVADRGLREGILYSQMVKQGFLS